MSGTSERSPSGVTRRALLEVGCLAAGLAVFGGVAEWHDSAISQMLASPDIAAIPSEVPPELRGKDLNTPNEHYRPHIASVLEDAFTTYRSWGGTPHYQRPRYYLTEWRMLCDTFDPSSGINPEKLKAWGKDYSPLLAFSSANFRREKALYTYDPGTSPHQQTQALFRARGLSERVTDDGITITPQQKIITEVYCTFFRDTLQYVRSVGGGAPIPTSLLAAHFLRCNKGDVMTSLLDTTLFLKLAARGNLDKMLGSTMDPSFFLPTAANAQLMSELFFDEFSPVLPYDKLVAMVPPQSELNDYGPHHQEARHAYKDYDPVNQVGKSYHAWNLIALCAGADPAVMQKITLAYYNPRLFEDSSAVRQQGRTKVALDMAAVAQANDIRAVINSAA